MKYSTEKIKQTVCQILDECSYEAIPMTSFCKENEYDLWVLAVDFIQQNELAQVTYDEDIVLEPTYAGYEFYEEYSKYLDSMKVAISEDGVKVDVNTIPNDNVLFCSCDSECYGD